MEHRTFASRYLLFLKLLRVWRALAPAGFRPDCIYTLARRLNPYQTLARKIATTLGNEFPERPSDSLWNDWIDNHTRFVMDFLDYDAITPRWVERNVEIANPECVAQIRQTGGLLLTYHTHHQNTLCCILGELGIRISPIGAAPEESPLFPVIGKWARRVNADSEKHFRGGSYLFTNDLRKLTRQMHNELHDRHVVLSLCDFHQPESASPQGTTLLNRKITPPVGAIQTALKNETPVYVAYLGKTGRKLRLDMARLQADSGVSGVMAQYLRYLEQRIQASPATWQGWEWFGDLPLLEQGTLMKTATPIETRINEPFEDITDVWNRCHSHLRPLDGATPGDETHGLPRLTARIRFGNDTWIEKVTITYSRDDQRYLLLNSDRASALGDRMDLLQTPVEAVDARLWSRTPTMINIEPTTRCNFNCWYCVGRHMEQADIRVEDFEKMLDNFPTLRTIALVGEGEPLLHKGFFEMAAMAKARGIRVIAISNGSAFSQSVVRQLCDVSITYISISIDSHDPGTFASSRIDGDLEKVLAGIKRLRDYRDANGFIYPKIGLKGTLFNDTKDQLPAIVDLARAAGAEVFESFQPLNPMKNYVRIYPQAHQKELPSVDVVSQAIAHDSGYGRTALQPMDAFCAEHGVELFRPVVSNPLRKNCDETWLYSLLAGDVTPCCQIKTPISPKWNVFKHSVDEILSDLDYENTRFNLWNGFFPDYCAGCWKTR